VAKPKGGLTEWFGKGKKGNWVDIGAPKKGGGFEKCGRSKLEKDRKRKYPKCVPAAKAAKMSKAEIKSAVRVSDQRNRALVESRQTSRPSPQRAEPFQYRRVVAVLSCRQNRNKHESHDHKRSTTWLDTSRKA
jgi:hypothetical protein